MENKLLEYTLRGLVIGAFGEASDDIHTMVEYLANARARYQRCLEGAWKSTRMSDEAEVAILRGQIRRGLSLEAVRSQARLLIERVGAVGVGTESAMKRRAWAAMEEVKMSRERRAYLICLAKGRPIVRKGMFLID